VLICHSLFAKGREGLCLELFGKIKDLIINNIFQKLQING